MRMLKLIIKALSTNRQPVVASDNAPLPVSRMEAKAVKGMHDDEPTLSELFFTDYNKRFCCAGTSRNDMAALVANFVHNSSGNQVIITDANSSTHVSNLPEMTTVTLESIRKNQLSFWPVIQLAFNSSDHSLKELAIITLRQTVCWLLDEYDPSSVLYSRESLVSILESNPSSFSDVLSALDINVPTAKADIGIESLLGQGQFNFDTTGLLFIVDDLPASLTHIFIALASLAGSVHLHDSMETGLMIINENVHYPARAKRSLIPFIASVLLTQDSAVVIRDQVTDGLYGDDEDPIYSICSHFLVFNGGVNMSVQYLRDAFSEVYPVEPHGDPGYFYVGAVNYQSHTSELLEIPRACQ